MRPEQPSVQEDPPASAGIDLAALSDVGTERDHNEDACGTLLAEGLAVLAVADGVSSSQGGEVASQMAIEVLLRAFGEEPADRPAGTRLYRAVQQANIEVYDRSLAVPELHGMATTLLALAVEGDALTAVHVGDSRLYLWRQGRTLQLTKDHTLAAERVRMGVLSAEKARVHPDKSVLTRSVGRELIVNRDRLSQPLVEGDILVACSDGLYNVLEDPEIGALASRAQDAAAACRALVEAANRRGTGDNLTAGVLRVTGSLPAPAALPPGGLVGRLRRLLGG
ncbi:MAG TPA: protein phosphatase 2C domain-containing protein [Anaeromyxobacter sp.]|nr:protein phosphatase 2C domain-containing protein [Anaeromyxobacter sp.]